MNSVNLIKDATYVLKNEGERFIKQNPRLLIISAIALVVFPILAYLYKKIQNIPFLPFQSWGVNYGLVSRNTFSKEEKNAINAIVSSQQVDTQKLNQVIQKYTPIQATQKFYDLLESGELINANETNQPKTPSEWLIWMTKNASSTSKLRRMAQQITWAYEEMVKKPEEDEKALKVQGWASDLEETSLIFNNDKFGIADSIFETIQNSPRLAYTLAFTFIAPIVTDIVWETTQDLMPRQVQAIHEIYDENKGKIALGLILATCFLFYKMKQEKGVFTNLTRQWKAIRGSHLGLDLVPTFGKQIHQILMRIGTTQPGSDGANILFFRNPKRNRTFKNVIGEVLAEMSATGRAANVGFDADIQKKLQNLQVWELDLGTFLSEYHETKMVFKGWQKAMSLLSREKNVLVVIKGFSQIQSSLLKPRREHRSRDNEEENFFFSDNNSGMTPAKLLSNLLITSLRQGQFRCILEIKEEDNESFKDLEDVYPLFTSFAAPDIPVDELESFFTRIYSSPERPGAIPANEISEWMRRLQPTMESDPQSPLELMNAMQNAIRERERAMRHPPAIDMNRDGETEVELQLRIQNTRNEWEKKINPVKRAEKMLREARWIKGELLKKLWDFRRIQQEEPIVYVKSLLLVEHVIIPIFANQLKQAKRHIDKQPHLIQDQLVKAVQSKFKRLFGAATPEESERLKMLPKILRSQIKGQDTAIDMIYNAVDKWRKVPSGKGKPLVLFFAGPTGIGKSHAAMQLADQLRWIFGLSENPNPGDKSNIIQKRLENKQGELWGWDNQREEILSRIHNRPMSVVIFEEWDKMKKDEMPNLLELLEDTPTSKTSSFSYLREDPLYVDRRSTIVIFTSNIAADILAKPLDKNGDHKKQISSDVENIKKGIIAAFGDSEEDGSNQNNQKPHAFLSRIDAIIPFHGISEIGIGDAIEIELERMIREGIVKAGDKEVLMRKVGEYVESRKYEKSDMRDLQRDISDVVYKHLKG